MKKICILDYGSGNVGSVKNILEFLKFDFIISNSIQSIKDSSHIILPGVGAFGKSMEKIKKKIPLDVLEDEIINKKKPFLGICVGMQVLFNSSEEFGNFEGLGWLKGKVKKIKAKILPHVGWNEIEITKENALLRNLENNKDFYFVNSFHSIPDDKNIIISETKYEEKFCSAIQKDNIFAVQFHPEKSQLAGQIILKNFFSI
jgi:glutamine amidotransferase|tara:strand:+ start:60 stop:665 length:606 start_codon:yes stop_codon:yes gene_type:complete